MAEQTREKSKVAERTRKRIWLAVAISLLVVAAVLVWHRSRFSTIEERLAAIEAAHAIPDSENAAILYNLLLADVDAVSLDESLRFLDGDANMLTRRQPWLERDYPELAAWIEEHQWLIDELLAATQLEKCRFPIHIEPYRHTEVSRLRTIRSWRFLLKRAANNDVAEGRIDDAIAKWRCLIQMGGHLQQQCTFIEYLEGMSSEAVGMNQAAVFVVEGNPDEHQLHKIASLPFEIQDDWDAILERIAPVAELKLQEYKKALGLVDRLKYELGIGLLGSMKGSAYKRIPRMHSRRLACKRGFHILVALRRYRNEHRRWPDGLDEIRPRLSAEILLDPVSKGAFVYRLTDDNFTLYNKGENNIDENGRYQGKPEEAPDDWPIWPPKGRENTD
ncbi:MAG: hypothetical protein ACYTGS_14950 [Planctomycetota bacterium]|jgi:hypothetical protein